jgi:hypothetical protein
MSPTGKVTDSPCIPRCAPDGVVSCALAGVRGGVSGSKQGRATRRRCICGKCDARTEGAGRSSPCPPEAVYFCFRFCMSPTGKGNDSPCIPRCAPDGVVSCALAGVRGGITGTAQGSTTRRRCICGKCDARTEGAGRSSPCPPEAVYFCFRFCMSPTGKGNDSPCIPRCAPDGVVSCALAGVRGGVSGSKQGRTTRRRCICGNCDARTEGAGRSSPCPPEAVWDGYTGQSKKAPEGSGAFIYSQRLIAGA